MPVSLCSLVVSLCLETILKIMHSIFCDSLCASNAPYRAPNSCWLCCQHGGPDGREALEMYSKYEEKLDLSAPRPKFDLSMAVVFHDVKLTLPTMLYGNSELSSERAPELLLRLVSPEIHVGIWLNDNTMAIHSVIDEMLVENNHGRFLGVRKFTYHNLDYSAIDQNANKEVSFAEKTEVQVEAVYGVLTVEQILDMVQWAKCFQYHYKDVDNHVDVDMLLPDGNGESPSVAAADLLFTALRAVVHSVDVQVVTDAEDTVLHIMTDGNVIVTSDTQCRLSSSALTRITSDVLHVRHYVNVASKRIPTLLNINVPQQQESGVALHQCIPQPPT